MRAIERLVREQPGAVCSVQPESGKETPDGPLERLVFEEIRDLAEIAAMREAQRTWWGGTVAFDASKASHSVPSGSPSTNTPPSTR